jgi:hypothetical protein
VFIDLGKVAGLKVAERERRKGCARANPFGPIQRLIVKATMLTDKLSERGGREKQAAVADVAQR